MATMKSINLQKNMKSIGFLLIGIILLSNASFANLDTLKSANQPPEKVIAGVMNNYILGEILKANSTVLENAPGFWQIQYMDRVLTVVTDQSHNRMRIMTAIVHKKRLKKSQIIEMLQAQFDRALDVKYALYNDVLWSAYIHPLKELTEGQVKDALSQVYFAAYNFGGSYRSTDLQFGNRTE